MVASLFLLITSCTSAPPREMIPADHPADLAGTWTYTDDWSGCDLAKKETFAIKITQEGYKITGVNAEQKYSFNGIILKDNIIAIEKYSYTANDGGAVTIYDYDLTISPDGNTLKGKVKWMHSAGCGGSAVYTFVRKADY